MICQPYLAFSISMTREGIFNALWRMPEKTTRTYMKLHREAPEHERRQYSLVHWPESFGTPELPWESAPAILAAIRTFPEGSRPTVRAAKWFWRLTLAGLAPASPGERLLWALLAVEYERSDAPPEAWRGLEQHLLQPEMEEPPIFSAYLNDLKRAAEAAARLGWGVGHQDLPVAAKVAKPY